MTIGQLFFGAMQIALGLALFGFAYVVGGPAWALAWPASSVLAVGVAYLGPGPGVFGKRRDDGRLSPLHVALLFPYFAVAWTLWQIKSRFFSTHAWNEIAPGVRLGRRPLSRAELPPDTRCVVDLCSELPRALPEVPVERYVCLPTLDTSAPPDAELAALIESIAEEEGPLYLHCAMGHGRSATVAAALLIRRGLCADVDDAVRTMKKARPGVHLHAIQRAAVERLARAAATIAGDDPTEDRPDRAPRVA